MIFKTLKTLLYEEYDRLILWLPILYAVGIGTYFSLDQEPPLPPLALMVAGLFVAALYFRKKNFLLYLLLVSALFVVAGFGGAALRTYLLDTATLEKKLSPRMVTGQVIDVRHYENGKLHVVLKNPEFYGSTQLHKLRIRIHKYEELPYPGDLVSVRAGLLPPPPPTMPGDFDYGRKLWFDGIGALGYAISPLKILEKGNQRENIRLRARLNISERIRNQLDGDKGGLAAALITGKRDGISEGTVLAMQNSGLAHLLAISGLHMGLLCGAAFFFVRFLLSRSEYLTLHYPIKKWAAIVALMAGAVYLGLSGGSVPTLRAYVMAFIVFLGILTDRKAISLRLVALAAMLILLSTPEVLLSVSFQMSFGAVVALVVVYEKLTPWLRAQAAMNNSFSRKIIFYLGGILLTTLVAELAIAPFALFHFNKLVQMGLLANLIAMPVMAFWVMPWIVVTLILLPFGLEFIALIPLSWGLEVIMETAQTISDFPGSYRLIPFIGLKPLVFLVMGFLWFGLWRHRWKYLGLPLMGVGIILAFMHRQPDILVDNGGRLIGVRSSQGQIMLSSLRPSRMTRARWAQNFGQEKADKWSNNRDGEGIKCDRLGCLYRPADLSMDAMKPDYLIALIRNERALFEDCQTARIVISLVPVKIKCPSAKLVIDRWDFYYGGGHALWLPEKADGQIRIETVAGSRGDRPWSVRKKRKW